MDSGALIGLAGLGLLATGMLCGVFFKLGCVDNKVKDFAADVVEIKTTVTCHTTELAEIKKNGNGKKD